MDERHESFTAGAIQNHPDDWPPKLSSELCIFIFAFLNLIGMLSAMILMAWEASALKISPSGKVTEEKG